VTRKRSSTVWWGAVGKVPIWVTRWPPTLLHVQFCEGLGVQFPRATHLVCAFERQEDAERFYRALGQRLGKFGLELSGEKTRVIPFSKEIALGKTSFDFLGFEFRWGKDLSGKPHVKKRTSRKKLGASLKRFNQWCKENKHHRLKVLFYRLNAKLRGYYNYYGVHGNSISLNQFYSHAMWMLWRQLNQRSQRKSYNWKGFNELLEQFQIERPRIVQRPRTSTTPSVA
jgi:RNA-directed DNA polymerase